MSVCYTSNASASSPGGDMINLAGIGNPHVGSRFRCTENGRYTEHTRTKLRSENQLFTLTDVGSVQTSSGLRTAEAGGNVCKFHFFIDAVIRKLNRLQAKPHFYR